MEKMETGIIPADTPIACKKVSENAFVAIKPLQTSIGEQFVKTAPINVPAESKMDPVAEDAANSLIVKGVEVFPEANPIAARTNAYIDLDIKLLVT